MIDANCAYDPSEALRVGRAAEEPLPPDDLDGYARLSEKLDVPVAAGESWALLSGFHEAFRRGAIFVAQPEGCSAGITEVKRIADLAHALNVPCIPHVWGTPIALVASLQVLAALPGRVLLEYDRSDNPVREALFDESLSVRDYGTVAVPTNPGIGLDECCVDWR